MFVDKALPLGVEVIIYFSNTIHATVFRVHYLFANVGKNKKSFKNNPSC